MARDEKLKMLGSVGLFSGLTRRELSHIARRADQIQAAAGHEVVREGTPGHEFFLIVTGEAVVRRDGYDVATLGPGDYFGELAILDGGVRSATVVAETDLALLVIGQREFVSVLGEVPTLATKLLASMARRLRQADSRAPTN